MINIFNDFAGPPVHFIRFNPDKYVSSVSSIKVETNLQKRLLKLVLGLKNIVNNSECFFKEHPALSCSYWYYDNYTNVFEVQDVY